MKVLAALIACLSLLPPAHCSLHPVLLNPRIEVCGDHGAGGACSSEVLYASDGIVLADILAAAPPRKDAGLDLMAIGIHCESGSSLTGVRFRGCRFVDDRGHRPEVVRCRLASYASWDLTPDSDCGIWGRYWAGHTGSGPGGECVLFVQKHGWSAGLADTIYGGLSPEQAANAGSTYCQKPLPPSVTCHVLLPDTIDHGVVPTNTRSVRHVDGSVDCGQKPVITILGGGNVQLARGVTTVITPQLVGNNQLRITSALAAVDGEPGEHRGSVVVIASPY